MIFKLFLITVMSCMQVKNILRMIILTAEQSSNQCQMKSYFLDCSYIDQAFMFVHKDLRRPSPSDNQEIPAWVWKRKLSLSLSLSLSLCLSLFFFSLSHSLSLTHPHTHKHRLKETTILCNQKRVWIKNNDCEMQNQFVILPNGNLPFFKYVQGFKSTYGVKICKCWTILN